MLNWLRKLLAPPPALPAPVDPARIADAVAPVVSTAVDGAVTALKGGQDELIESVKKLARANQKLALQVEALAAKPAPAPASAPAPAPPPEPRLDDLLDAMDAIDRAMEGVEGDEALASFAEGLEGVQARLERFLDQLGVSRVGARGEAPESRLLKVVGTTDDEDDDIEEGAVVRVIRAGACKGERVLRVGEVITRRIS